MTLNSSDVSVGIALFIVVACGWYFSSRLTTLRKQSPRTTLQVLQQATEEDPENDMAENLLIEEEGREIND